MAKLKQRGRRQKRTIRLTRFFLRYTVHVLLLVLLTYGIAAGLYGMVHVLGGMVLEPISATALGWMAEDMLEGDLLDARRMIQGDEMYAVFSSTGELRYGNASVEAQQRMWASFAKRGPYADADGIAVQKGDEVRIVEHRAYRNVFRNAFLRRLIPNAEAAMLMLACFLMVMCIVLLALRYGKRLARTMKTLAAATQRIQAQDLDFDIGHSEFREINEVLLSMDSMKTALRQALAAQWEMEQERIAQMASLTHDIHTPLTIIQGNAELLLASGAQEGIQEYAGYIVKNTRLIQTYIETLQQLSQAQPLPLQPIAVDVCRLWEELKGLLLAMCAANQLTPYLEGTLPGGMILADLPSLTRAFGNVLSNAAHFTPALGTITLRVEAHEDAVCFTIQDTGPGFSALALQHATEQHFTERSGSDPHGMGLYTARRIALQHRGTLFLCNAKGSGACVSICLPFAGR